MILKILTPLFICTLGLVACKKQTKSSVSTSDTPLDYSNFMDRHILWNDLLKQINADYYAYIYSESCGHCKEIKEVVLNYAFENENFYLIKFDKDIPISSDSNEMVGLDDISLISIVGTPSLFQITEGVIGNYIVGSKAIVETLSNVS